MVLLLAGCAKQQAYDDSAVWEKLANLEQRVSTLESSIRGIQSAVGEGKFVQKVQEITDAAGNVTGITVTYTTGEVVTLNIGNADPEAGPVISVMLNGAGELCWAIDGVIIQQNGKDVTVYQYPEFSIDEEGHLWVEVDGEKTDLGLVKGEKGDKGEDGQGGAIQDGIIKGITVGEENIEILLDDTTITLPLTLAFKLVVAKTDYAVTSTDPIEVAYEVKNKTPQTVVDAYCGNDFEVEVQEDKIIVTPASKSSFGDILLYADSKTGLTSIVKLHFEGEVFKPDYVPYSSDIDFVAEADGGSLEVPVVSNLDFDVVSGDSWITYVETKAKKATIVLTIAENPKATVRTGGVNLFRKGTEDLIMTIVIAQQAGTPKATNLSANGTANSYIVNEAGWYKFAAVKGNTTEALEGASEAALLWETWNNTEDVAVNSVIASVKYADGFVEFTTPETLKPGNALIAVKNADGDILWSWHIWIPKTAITLAEEANYSAKKTMSRNLGALIDTPAEGGAVESFGLLYEWGRKDPFPGLGVASGTGSATVAGTAITYQAETMTIEESIKNPTVYVNVSGKAWTPAETATESDGSLWGETTKTVYDPCPVGYMLPQRAGTDFWKGTKMQDITDAAVFSHDADKGIFTVGSLVFPLAGYIDDGGEAHKKAGVRSILWSGRWDSGTHGGYGFYAYEDSDGPYFKRTSITRSRGGSVRCVAE